MKAKIITFTLSLLLSIFIYPSAFFYPKDTLPDTNDTRLIAYIINQVQQNILNKQSLYHATFFAPEPNPLTYSDIFLTSSIISLPARLFTNHPISIFNITFILGLTLTIFTSYYFFLTIFNDIFTASIATIIFNLSGFHLHYYPHLQVFSLWIFFSALTSLIKFLKNMEVKYLHYFLIFFTLQVAETIFTSYLLFFTSLALVLPRHKLFIKEVCKPKYLFYPATWLLLVLPYAKMHFMYPDASRPIRDAAHFSLGLDQIFTTYHSWTTISLFFISTAVITLLRNYPESQKPGIFLSEKNFCDEAKTVAKRWWSKPWFLQKSENRGEKKPWIYLLYFSLIMSLGPVLKIFGNNLRLFGLPIPLPYSLFYYLFPGFTGFRTPSRFIILSLISATVLIGTYSKPVVHKLNFKIKFLILALVFSLLSLEAKLPLTGYPININTHPVYQQVKSLPKDAVILELPIKLWNMPNNEIESIRSLYSLEHKHSRLGGYSGFATLDWIKLVEKINTEGLSPVVIQKLKNRGITHAIENNQLFPL